MTIPMNLAWLADTEAAILRLCSKKLIADHEFFDATVSRVEEGFHWSEDRRITLSELDAWAERCQRSDQRKPDDQDQPSNEHAQDRRVLHPRP